MLLPERFGSSAPSPAAKRAIDMLTGIAPEMRPPSPLFTLNRRTVDFARRVSKSRSSDCRLRSILTAGQGQRPKSTARRAAKWGRLHEPPSPGAIRPGTDRHLLFARRLHRSTSLPCPRAIARPGFRGRRRAIHDLQCRRLRSGSRRRNASPPLCLITLLTASRSTRVSCMRHARRKHRRIGQSRVVPARFDVRLAEAPHGFRAPSRRWRHRGEPACPPVHAPKGAFPPAPRVQGPVCALSRV